MRRDASLILALAMMLAIPGSLAQATTSDWNAIEPAARTLLAPWQDQWSALPEPDRRQLLAHARQWQGMNQAARDALSRRQAQWLAQPPAERARQRARYAAWQDLSSGEQDQVRQAAARFAALPAAQQAALRARFGAQPREWQQAWLRGPSIGAWLDQAGMWFAYVPSQEREATLRMLQDLAPDARTQLFELSRRLSAPQREALRKNLLLTAPSARASLIASKLAP